MTALSGKDVKDSADKLSSVRAGVDSNFTKEKSVRAATERTGGERDLNNLSLFGELRKIYDNSIYNKISHLRGTTRLKNILQSLALRDVDSVDEDEVKDIFEEEWENLIIIDACRADFWKQETGMKGSRVSKTSSTPEFIEKVFSKGDFSDIVYVAANPQFSDWKFEKLTGRKPDDVFHEIFKTFNTDWNEENNTVLAEPVIRDALTAKNLFPDKKVIVHFLQPHYPFVRKPTSRGGISKNLVGRTDSAWNLAELGKVSHEKVEQGYRDNINYIQRHIEKFNQKLDGKTILTSDHGNFVGEGGFYGHPVGLSEKPVREVPWVELE